MHVEQTTWAHGSFFLDIYGHGTDTECNSLPPPQPGYKLLCESSLCVTLMICMEYVETAKNYPQWARSCLRVKLVLDLDVGVIYYINIRISCTVGSGVYNCIV